MSYWFLYSVYTLLNEQTSLKLCTMLCCIACTDANSGLHDFMESLEEFNFLFKDDLMLEYKKFQDTEPTVHQHRTRVEQWHALEQRVSVDPWLLDRYLLTDSGYHIALEYDFLPNTWTISHMYTCHARV